MEGIDESSALLSVFNSMSAMSGEPIYCAILRYPAYPAYPAHPAHPAHPSHPPAFDKARILRATSPLPTPANTVSGLAAFFPAARRCLGVVFGRQRISAPVSQH